MQTLTEDNINPIPTIISQCAHLIMKEYKLDIIQMYQIQCLIIKYLKENKRL